MKVHKSKRSPHQFSTTTPKNADLYYAELVQVLVHIEEQSPDIGQGVHGLGTKTLEEVGAGDQGHMFGYATDETEQLMPLTHVLATQLGYKLTEVQSAQKVLLLAMHGLSHSNKYCTLESPLKSKQSCRYPASLWPCTLQKAIILYSDSPLDIPPVTSCISAKSHLVAQVRKNGTVPWLRPDGKTQVTVEYKKDNGAMVPQRVHTILISTQHSPDVTNDQIHKDLMEHVIKAVVPAKYLDDKTIFHLNPSGEDVRLPVAPASNVFPNGNLSAPSFCIEVPRECLAS